MIIRYILNIVSDNAFVLASIIFVEAFGIEKRKEIKYQICRV